MLHQHAVSHHGAFADGHVPEEDAVFHRAGQNAAGGHHGVLHAGAGQILGGRRVLGLGEDGTVRGEQLLLDLRPQKVLAHQQVILGVIHRVLIAVIAPGVDLEPVQILRENIGEIHIVQIAVAVDEVQNQLTGDEHAVQEDRAAHVDGAGGNGGVIDSGDPAVLVQVQEQAHGGAGPAV